FLCFGCAMRPEPIFRNAEVFSIERVTHLGLAAATTPSWKPLEASRPDLPCCARHVVAFASNDARVAPCHQPSPVAQFRVGSLSQAAELFCAGARNCPIRVIASRHGGPAALLDDRSPVP